MSYIILRDIPKQSIQLDLLVYQIQGGFRGFREVPAGFHYGAILSEGQWRDFYCYLPPETVGVKKFDSQLQQFVEDTPEQVSRYSQLAAENAMDQVLQSYAINQWSDWQGLTGYITTDSPRLYLDGETPKFLSGEEVKIGDRTRFEKAFFVTHQCNIQGFLAEFQFAFLGWWMSQKGKFNQVAQHRWSSLLNGMYNAGESAIASHPELFSKFVDVLLAQLSQLPTEAFTPNSIICTHLDYLIEDMNDTQILSLQQKARSLSTYIQQRQSISQYGSVNTKTLSHSIFDFGFAILD